MKDLHNNIKVVHLLDAQDISADTWTKYVDLAGFESCEVIVNVGAATPLSGSAYITPVLYEADSTPTDNGSYSAVASTDILGAFTAIDSQTEAQASQSVGYIGAKRYLAVKLEATGSVSNFLVSVNAVLSNARHATMSAPTTGTIT